MIKWWREHELFSGTVSGISEKCVEIGKHRYSVPQLSSQAIRAAIKDAATLIEQRCESSQIDKHILRWPWREERRTRERERERERERKGSGEIHVRGERMAIRFRQRISAPLEFARGAIRHVAGLKSKLVAVNRLPVTRRLQPRVPCTCIGTHTCAIACTHGTRHVQWHALGRAGRRASGKGRYDRRKWKLRFRGVSFRNQGHA